MHKEVKTQDEFNAAVAAGNVLVDFWATWCGPCQMMGQLIETQLEPSMPDLTVVKVNVDEAPELAAQFGVMSIPALFCFKNGVKCGEFIGVTQVSSIKACY
jgi:thioredoxin 1